MIKNISAYTFTSDLESRAVSSPTISNNIITVDNINYKYFSYTANGSSSNSSYRTSVSTASFIGFTDADFGSATSGTINMPAGLIQNDVVFIFVGSDGGLPANITGWTTINSGSTTGGLEYAKAYYKVMGATPDTSATIPSGIATSSCGVAAAFRGIDISALSNTITIGVGNVAPDSPSIVTSYNDSLIISSAFLDDTPAGTDASVRAPTGYTLIDAKSSSTLGQTVMVAYKIEKLPGTYDPGAFSIGGDIDDMIGITIQVPGPVAKTLINLVNPLNSIQIATHVITSNESLLPFMGIGFINSNVFISRDSSSVRNNTYIPSGSKCIVNLSTVDYGNSWTMTDIIVL